MAVYDLEERTLTDARKVRDFLKKIPFNFYNEEYCKQLVRSSASVGANYIEANESLSEKDLIYRIKICRKEAKESSYWMKLIDVNEDIDLELEKDKLMQEFTELMNIFGAIYRKKENRSN